MISSADLHDNARIDDRAATFEQVAAAIPDRVGVDVEINPSGGSPFAPAPADSGLEVSKPMVGSSLAAIFNVAAELLAEPAMQLSDSERDELGDLWHEPVNRLIKKHLGETENGDLWLAAGCTFMVLASKSERIRAIVSKITAPNGSITPSGSGSPTAEKPIAQN